MACGVPVVYAASGGTVELVGEEAGTGVPHTESWERQQPPTPEALADGMAKVLADLQRYREAARRRAVERFALTPWLDRHARAVRRASCRHDRTSPGARYPAMRPRSVARWKRARLGSRRSRETTAPPTGRTSIRVTTLTG